MSLCEASRNLFKAHVFGSKQHKCVIEKIG